MVLYFGCRHSSLDELYNNEIKDLVETKVITSYNPAYSRSYKNSQKVSSKVCMLY